MGMRRAWKPLLALVLVASGALVYVGHHAWVNRCGAAAEELSAADVGPVLGSPDDVAEQLEDGLPDLTHPLGPEFVDVLTDLPDPFGDLVAGRLWKSLFERPSVGTFGDDGLVLAGPGGIPGSEYDGAVVAADAATGEALWGVGVTGYGAGGGPVGDSYVTLGIPEDRAPELAAYDLKTGDRQGCTTLGDDMDTGFEPPLDSVALEGDDVVVAWPADEGVTVGRFDPVDGDESWHTAVATTTNSVRVDDLGSVLAVSQFDGEEIDTNKTLNQGQGHVRGVTALDAADGSVAWTWPDPEPDVLAGSVIVTGADSDLGLVFAIEVSLADEDSDMVRDLVALDDTGAEVWREPLDSEYCNVGHWDDLVVSSCPNAPLAARDESTGELLWSDPGDSDLVGGLVRPQSGRSVDLGDGTRLQLADDGLIQVDVATGAITHLVTEEALGSYVSGIDLVGEHLVLSTESGIFVFDRSSG